MIRCCSQRTPALSVRFERTLQRSCSEDREDAVGRRGDDRRERRVLDRRVRPGEELVRVHRPVVALQRSELLDPLSTAHGAEDVGIHLLVPEPGFEVVVALVVADIGNVVVPGELLVRKLPVAVRSPEAAGGRLDVSRVVQEVGLVGPARTGHRRDVLPVVGELAGHQPLGAEDSLVPEAEVRPADRNRTLVRAGRTNDLSHGADVVGGIAEHGGDDRLALADVPRELSGEEIARSIEVRHGPDLWARRHLALVGVLQVVVRSEEPERVLQNESADVRAEILARKAHRDALGRLLQLAVGVRPGPSDAQVLVLGLQAVVVVVAEDVAVKLVAAGLGDHVQDPALGARVLGLVSPGLQLHFLNELEVQNLALGPDLGAGRVGSIDKVLVLEARRSIDRDRGLADVRVVCVDSTRELGDRCVVAPGREGLEGLRVHVAADGVGGRLDDRRLGADRHGRRRCREELETDRGGLVETERQRLALGRKSVEGRRDRVGARGKQLQVETPFPIRDGRPHALQVGALGLDRDAGKRRAVGPDDLALDAPRGLGRGRKREEEDGNRGPKSNGELLHRAGSLSNERSVFVSSLRTSSHRAGCAVKDGGRVRPAATGADRR